jgi:tetratricopeptide (TPR) repeat protein
MIKLPTARTVAQLTGWLSMGLVLLSLISCDNKESTTTSTVSTATTSDAQQFPKFDSFQPPSEIDQLKARLFDNPEDINILNSLADLYFESAQYTEAIRTYKKVLAIDPTCADCFNDIGLASFYQGDAVTALASFDKAIAIRPEFPHAWLSKGFVLVSEGRFEEAVAPLNKVKELDTTGKLSAAADNFLAKIAEEKRR